MSCSDGDPTGFKNPSRRIFQLPHSISHFLLASSAWFLKIFALSRPLLSFCALLSSFHVLFLVNFIPFNIIFFITVRILIILGIFLDYKMHICDICCVGIICFSIIVDCIVKFTVWNFWKSPFYCRYNDGFSIWTDLILFELLLANLVGYFSRIMIADSPQHRVRQRTERDRW